MRDFHPLANLFPLLQGGGFQDLVADIQKNGLREPILVDDQGRILDGRNRYRACLEAGVEPQFVNWTGKESVTELVLSLNLHRRHLNESQRAMVAARLARELGKDAVKRKSRLDANLHPALRGRSAPEAGARINVSTRLTNHAVKVLRDGCEKLIAAVESGALAVSTASELAGLPREEQAKVVAEGVNQVSARVREIRAGKNPLHARPVVSFGLMDSDPPTVGAVSLVWVETAGVPEAIAALRARGFHYASSQARS